MWIISSVSPPAWTLVRKLHPLSNYFSLPTISEKRRLETSLAHARSREPHWARHAFLRLHDKPTESLKPGFHIIVRIVPVVSKKKCSDDRNDHMETLPRRSQTTRAIQNLHDRPDRPDRTQFYPSDRGSLSRPGRLRSSGWRFHMIVPVVGTFFLRRLGRLGRSGRSYGNQALRTSFRNLYPSRSRSVKNRNPGNQVESLDSDDGLTLETSSSQSRYGDSRVYHCLSLVSLISDDPASVCLPQNRTYANTFQYNILEL